MCTAAAFDGVGCDPKDPGVLSGVKGSGFPGEELGAEAPDAVAERVHDVVRQIRSEPAS